MISARPSPTHSPVHDRRPDGLRDRTIHDQPAPPLSTHGETVVANESSLLALQRTFGNAHVARLVAERLQRQPAGKPVAIGDEQVIVASDAEKTEAEQIFKEIKEKYGIRMSSRSGISAIDSNYEQVPETVRKQVKTTAWTMEELRALARALTHFAPILGKERASSSRSGSKQETASASSIEQGINENTSKGKFVKKLKAQQFDDLRNITLYSSLTEFPADFKGDRVLEIEGIITHELAHGLLDYATDDYLKHLDYWKTGDAKSGKQGAEAPITDYGATNLDEDLGDAVRFYFLAPDKLKNGRGEKPGKPGNPCPKRFALIDGYVKAWKRTPPKTP
jgi:hypothetical protein